ncbi:MULTISPECIES: cytochrome b/b6 domain-containing protein [unclassified Agarivorans]|uniref:cytochrome b/b6 domain-containing protein n=1 Tax=unclassified Agarivorans TaxID=2636026 RepID=UPI003D7D85D1
MTKHYVWDWLVRLTHWTVAILFLSNFLLLEEGSELHQWAGYGVLAAIATRLVWGLITRSPARLSTFRPSIAAGIAHLKEVLVSRQDQHHGHNPAGALMIWLMWFLLIATGLSGWATQTDLFWGEEWLEKVHGLLADLCMIAVAIHVSAVIIMTKITGNPYLNGILWGRKN